MRSNLFSYLYTYGSINNNNPTLYPAFSYSYASLNQITFKPSITFPPLTPNNTNNNNKNNEFKLERTNNNLLVANLVMTSLSTFLLIILSIYKFYYKKKYIKRRMQYINERKFGLNYNSNF